MARSIFLISSSIGVLATSAMASDLTITSRLSETVELNDNFRLANGPSSGVIGSYNSLFMTGTYRTPTTRFVLGGDVGYRKYWGSQADIGTFNETTEEGANLHFEKFGRKPGDRDFFAASYRRRDASLIQREDVGVVTVRGDALISSVSGGLSRAIDRINTVTWNAGYNSTTYSPTGSGVTPNSGITTSLALSHRVDPLTQLTTSTDFGWLIFDDAVETKTMYWRVAAGWRSQVSPRLTISANAGVSSYTTTKDNPAAAFAPVNPLSPFNIAPATAGTTIGPNVDVGFTYRLLKRTDLTGAVSYGTSQGGLGELSTRFNVSAGLSHAVNSRSNITVSGSFVHIDASSAFAASDFYTATAGYSYKLSKDWLATATYIYRLRNASTGSASSNSALFVVSRDMTLKP